MNRIGKAVRTVQEIINERWRFGLTAEERKMMEREYERADAYAHRINEALKK